MNTNQKQHIYKYIDLNAAKESIFNCEQYDVKKSTINNKYYCIFKDEDGEIIEERRCFKDSRGDIKCLDKKPDHEPVENSFTRKFTNDTDKAISSYEATTFIVSPDPFNFTKNNAPKHRVQYLNKKGEVIATSYCIKTKRDSYLNPYETWYKLKI